MKKMKHLWFNTKILTIGKMRFFVELLKNRIEKNIFSAMKSIIDNRPLVYSCSGCSGSAQMANYPAVQLDRWEL